MLQQTNDGVVFFVKVIPKAQRSQIVEWQNGELKIRLAAVPEKGKANDELLRYLSKVLGVGKSYLQMINGETSRRKQILVKGIALNELQKMIQKLLEKSE